MRPLIWNFLSVACLCGYAPFAWSGPEQRIDGDNSTLAVNGEIKWEYFNLRAKDSTGKIGKDEDILIEKAVLALTAKFNAPPDVTLVLATEKAGTPDYEPFFVKELILSHDIDSNHRLIAGRMELPFGLFKTTVPTDPQTKKIGKSKTDAGLGVKGKNDAARLDWNLIAFADDYRTPGPGANGITVNITWRAADSWTVGAGIITDQQARTQAPALVNIHAGMRSGAWGFAGEFVTALDDTGGEEPRAISLDGSIDLAPRIRLGARAQAAARLKYNELALAVKYLPSTKATMGVEYLAARQGETLLDRKKIGRFTAQVILLL